MKILCVDVETTGLDKKRCATHQLSGSVIIDGKVVKEFDFKIRPFEGALIQEDALKVAGVTLEQIMAYPEHRVVFADFTHMLEQYVSPYDKKDKFFIMGFNCQTFDSVCLRNFFSKCNNNYYGSYFHANTLDVMLLATPYLADVRHEMPNFKLATVANYCGIYADNDKLHDASYDIYLTKAIYDIVCNKY